MYIQAGRLDWLLEIYMDKNMGGYADGIGHTGQDDGLFIQSNHFIGHLSQAGSYKSEQGSIGLTCCFNRESHSVFGIIYGDGDLLSSG
ncbi:predicted protein [Lichtheimia corymbifera JMRC:FSU:9682]|uniref:Uncharacterized protein n=1 Tax=Lichtheimia corymbifera JMRC:FSU:9682 TaxID=1263082 RepID=A0A068RWG0_9FUNG|nr:predicted protein [Lichtheimia corymbifera JMRC:FSU:9682]